MKMWLSFFNQRQPVLLRMVRAFPDFVKKLRGLCQLFLGKEAAIVLHYGLWSVVDGICSQSIGTSPLQYMCCKNVSDAVGAMRQKPGYRSSATERVLDAVSLDCEFPDFVKAFFAEGAAFNAYAIPFDEEGS
jgi:hypothetical protein